MCIPPDDFPTRPELFAEVRRLVPVAAGVPPVQTRVEWVDGRPVMARDRPEPYWPVLGSAQWWAASEPVRIAALVVLAEAWLFADPDRTVREYGRNG